MPRHEFKHIFFRPTSDELQNTIRLSRFVKDLEHDLKVNMKSFCKEINNIIKKCSLETDKLFTAWAHRQEELDWNKSKKKVVTAKEETLGGEYSRVKEKWSLYLHQFEKLSLAPSGSNESACSSNSGRSVRSLCSIRRDTVKSNVISAVQMMEEQKRSYLAKKNSVDSSVKSDDAKENKSEKEGKDPNNDTLVATSVQAERPGQVADSTLLNSQSRMTTRSRQSEFQENDSKLVAKSEANKDKLNDYKMPATECKVFQHKLVAPENVEQVLIENQAPVKVKDTHQKHLPLAEQNSGIDSKAGSSSASPSVKENEMSAINVAKTNKTLVNSSSRRFGSGTKRWNRGVRTVHRSVRKTVRRVPQSAKKGTKKKSNLMKNLEQVKQPVPIVAAVKVEVPQEPALETPLSARRDAVQAIEYLQQLKRMLNQNFALLLNSLPDDVLDSEMNKNIEYVFTQDPNDIILQHLRKLHQESKITKQPVRVINPLEESVHNSLHMEDNLSIKG